MPNLMRQNILLELDFGQNLNGLAIDQGAKHGVHQFLIRSRPSRDSKKNRRRIYLPGNALSPALSKLAKVELGLCRIPKQ